MPVAPAIIEVNATCTLVDAINAANYDDDRGGLCPPGGTGHDTLELTADLVVSEDNYSGNAFPTVVERGGCRVSQGWQARGGRR